jgi:nucleotide-binding universal stress UspA family protein
VQQFQKRAKIIVHTQVLIAAKIVRLQAVNKAASERKTCTKKQIQHKGTLLQQEVEEIIKRRDANALVKAERHKERVRTGSSRQGS